MNIKVGLVRFVNNGISKTYAFYTDIINLQRNEPVVVDTENGYVVAFFQEYVNNKTRKASKWIVQRVDVHAHINKMAEQSKLEKLRSEIEQRRAALEQETIYKLLAKDDPTLANLLAEYKKAGGRL